MKRRLFIASFLWIITLGLILSFTGQGKGQKTVQPGLGNPEVHKLSKNVYAVTGIYHTSIDKGFTTNAGIIFTPGSVIFIDSGQTIASAEFLWDTARKRMKGNEKIYLILTHHHSDHVFGMRIFKDKNAKIIAHEGVKEELKEDNGFYKNFIAKKMGWNSEKADEILGDVLLSVPDQTIDKDTVLKIDRDDIHLFCTTGHVDDEISVYHPASKTLFAGDAIYEGTAPATQFGDTEKWKTWIFHLERLAKLEIQNIIPGHGKICKVDILDQNITFLKGKLKTYRKNFFLIKEAIHLLLYFSLLIPS